MVEPDFALGICLMAEHTVSSSPCPPLAAAASAQNGGCCCYEDSFLCWSKCGSLLPCEVTVSMPRKSGSPLEPPGVPSPHHTTPGLRSQDLAHLLVSIRMFKGTVSEFYTHQRGTLELSLDESISKRVLPASITKSNSSLNR